MFKLDSLPRYSWFEVGLIVCLCFIVSGVFRLFYGTFIIDHAMLTLIPYFVTYHKSRLGGLDWKIGKSILENPDKTFYKKLKYVSDRGGPISIPITIIAMWIGGTLPYFNLIPAESVYAGLFPAGWLGVNGNDFMWNGFLFPLGIGRIVPLTLQPTHQFALFNIYAVVYWLSLPIVMLLAIAKGRHSAFLKIRGFHSGLFKEKLMIFSLTVFYLIFDATLATLLVQIYSQ